MGKFVVKETATGVKFDLKAGNGQVIATSEVYSSEAACLNGIESVKKNAPVAAVEDQTKEGFATEKNCCRPQSYCIWRTAAPRRISRRCATTSSGG